MNGHLDGAQRTVGDTNVRSAGAAVAAHTIRDTLRIPLAARALGDAWFPRAAVQDLTRHPAGHIVNLGGGLSDCHG